MAVRAKGEKKKGRYVMATDAEWARIGEAAEAAGLSKSEFLLRRALEPGVLADSEGVGLPPFLLRRLVRTVLVLERLEQLRLSNDGAEDLWERLVAEADAWVDEETRLG